MILLVYTDIFIEGVYMVPDIFRILLIMNPAENGIAHLSHLNKSAHSVHVYASYLCNIVFTCLF